MAVFAPRPETFVVEEIAAYLPQGTGAHTYLWIEKKEVTTPEATRRLARALNVQARDIGYAGMKDRHATTRQWVSVPGVPPQTAQAVDVDGVRVLEARRHNNKLRVGHLRGNRFEVVIEEAGDGEAEAIAAAFEAVVRSGLPNTYGHQRFGAVGDNVGVGVALLRGERRERDPRRRRLFLSAVQSAVFNRVVALRAESGDLRRVISGDVLVKTHSGGLFITEDLAIDQARVDEGEIVPTGPMPGTREMEPPPGSEAHAVEERALAEVGVTREDLAKAGRDLPGARRPLVVAVTPGEPPVSFDHTCVTLRFSLPPGSYATICLEAVAVRLAAMEMETLKASHPSGATRSKPVLTLPFPAAFDRR